MKAALSIITFAIGVSAAGLNIPLVDIGLVKRQDVSEKCQDALEDLLPVATTIPMPDEDLTSALLGVTITDPCDTSDLPEEVLEDLSSYSSTVMEWFSSHSDLIESVSSVCTEINEEMTSLPVCADAAAATTTLSADEDDKPTSTGTTKSPVLVAGIAVVAMFVGIIAL